MLQVIIPSRELFNEESQEFITVKGGTLQLEHSLVSLSKWESKWCKPFLNSKKTNEEVIDYIRFMTITQNVPNDIYENIPNSVFSQIDAYISADMTATWFSDNKDSRKSREVFTAEIFYYCMIALNIQMECQKWHLNRLITLIRVCDIKSKPAKKMGKKEMLSTRQALNEARKSQCNTKG